MCLIASVGVGLYAGGLLCPSGENYWTCVGSDSAMAVRDRILAASPVVGVVVSVLTFFLRPRAHNDAE